MSTKLRDRFLRLLAIACLTAAALALTAGQASAAAYPAGGSSFTGSAEGWSGSSTCTVTATLACETSAGYEGTAGDPAGSLDVKTQVLVNALGVFNVNATEESPGFKAAASGPATLAIERQFESGGLIALKPRINYTVTLLDHSDGTKQQAVAETIEAATPFTQKTASVNLTAGDTYSILIAAEVNSTAASLGVTGTADLRFDNVSVTTAAGEGGAGGGGGAGSGATGGGSGNAAGGGVSAARLESLIQSAGLVGPAVLKGNKLSVKAKCPAKVGRTCTITLSGMLNRHKPATTARKAKVKKGKTRKFALKVKPAARAKLKTAKKVLFKETVKVGKTKVTVYKKLKLIHR
jgi:hypothetical protein